MFNFFNILQNGTESKLDFFKGTHPDKLIRVNATFCELGRMVKRNLKVELNFGRVLHFSIGILSEMGKRESFERYFNLIMEHQEEINKYDGFMYEASKGCKRLTVPQMVKIQKQLKTQQDVSKE